MIMHTLGRLGKRKIGFEKAVLNIFFVNATQFIFAESFET